MRSFVFHLQAPGRKSADLFGNGELLLEKLARRDVLDDPGRPTHPAIHIPYDRSGDMGPNNFPGTCYISLVQPVLIDLCAHHSFMLPKVDRAIVWMRQVLESDVWTSQSIHAVTGETAELPVRIHDAPSFGTYQNNSYAEAIEQFVRDARNSAQFVVPQCSVPN